MGSLEDHLRRRNQKEVERRGTEAASEHRRRRSERQSLAGAIAAVAEVLIREVGTGSRTTYGARLYTVPRPGRNWFGRTMELAGWVVNEYERPANYDMTVTHHVILLSNGRVYHDGFGRYVTWEEVASQELLTNLERIRMSA